ncbi:MAG: hypothetical protein AAB215_05845, partial [Planctomycetota bacterium]
IGFGMYSFRDYFLPPPGKPRPPAASCHVGPGYALLYGNSAFFRPETAYADQTDPDLDVEIPFVLPGQPIPFKISGSDAGSGPALVGIDFEGVTKHIEDLRKSEKRFAYEYSLKPDKPLAPGMHQAGVCLWDKASLRTYAYPSFRVVRKVPPVPPPPSLDPREVVYLEDDLEVVKWDTAGPDKSTGSGGEWCWSGVYKASGKRGIVHPTEAGKQKDIFLFSAPKSLSLKPGDQLTFYVYVDPNDRPETIAVSWFKNTWGWSTTAYWGADRLVNWDKSRPTRVRMGDLPSGKGWVRLAVPPAAVGMDGKAVGGIQLQAVGGGNVFWDRFGKLPRRP